MRLEGRSGGLRAQLRKAEIPSVSRYGGSIEQNVRNTTFAPPDWCHSASEAPPLTVEGSASPGDKR
jgi:hypothetical protein